MNAALLFSKSSKQSQQPTPSKPQADSKNQPSQTTQQIPPKKTQNPNQGKVNPFATKKTPQIQTNNDIMTKTPSSNLFGNQSNELSIFQNKTNDNKGLFNQPQGKTNLFDNKGNDNPIFKNQQSLFSVQSNKGHIFQKQESKGNIFTSSNNQSNQLKTQQKNLFELKTKDTQKQSLSSQTQSSNKMFSLVTDLKDKNINPKQQTVKPPPFFGATQSGNLFGSNQSTSVSLFGKKDETPKPSIFGNLQQKAPNSLFSIATPGANIFSTKKDASDQKMIPQNRNEQKKVNIIQQLPLQSSNFLKKQNKVFDNQPELNDKGDIKIKQNQSINKVNDSNNIINKNNQPSTNTQMIQQTDTQKRLNLKRQEIWSIIKQIEQNKQKLYLQSKLIQLKNIHHHHQQNKQQQQHLNNQHLQLSSKIKQLQQQLQQNNQYLQKLHEQNSSINHFESIVSSQYNQMKDQQQKMAQPFIDGQMVCLIQKLNEYYVGGESIISSSNVNEEGRQKDAYDNNNNPQCQIRQIYKHILSQQNKYQTLSNENITVNLVNTQRLKLTQSLKQHHPINKILKPNLSKHQHQHQDQHNDQHQNVSMPKQNNISQLQNSSSQQQTIQSLTQLRRQNRKRMRDVFLKKQQLNKHNNKQKSKISQGRTSIIMQSIIMVGQK